MMTFYKIEECIPKHLNVSTKCPELIDLLPVLDDLVEKRDLVSLKNITIENLSKNDLLTDTQVEYMITMSKRVSHTGWGIPSAMIRSDEIILFDECVYWRNEIVEILLKSKGV